MKTQMNATKGILIILTTIVMILQTACKKSKDTASQPVAVTTTVTGLEFTTLPSSVEANTAEAVFTYNGVEKHVIFSPA